ncbi:hypothetical protein NDU88_004238 [Pleurodeles waltl]|uniref:Uncharacterized protein n=1 Tax=Pleurodeles waltl TaxID=8319 RepID=A0AAV7TQR0_PLEWA|nr:hypothetical protein NDU88_004238 [Pleurodeles waltl]
MKRLSVAVLTGRGPRGEAAARTSRHSPPSGNPRLSTRSRPRLLRLFGASSARASLNAIVRRGWTPRAPCGAAVRRSI